MCVKKILIQIFGLKRARIFSERCFIKRNFIVIPCVLNYRRLNLEGGGKQDTSKKGYGRSRGKHLGKGSLGWSRSRWDDVRMHLNSNELDVSSG